MKSALRITLIYSLIGIAWIILSDTVLDELFADDELYTEHSFQMAKGIFYVIVTAIILYALINKYNRRLESKVREHTRLNDLLEYQRNKLTESNNQLEQFADITSHDLKSPLRTMVNLIDRFKQKFGDAQSAESLKYIEVIKSSALQLSRKVEKTLLFSKVNYNSKDYEKVNIQNLLKDIKNLLAVDIEKKNVTIECNQRIVIKSDKIMLQHIFQNLIENSIKYCKPDEDPHISISYKSADDHYLFEVKDNGIGIPKDKLEHVFERYEQLNKNDFMQGNGIGLASIKRIAERLNGEICLDSELGVGTSVSLKLPKVD